MVWWNEPNKRVAYYRNLRINYGFPALEAWQEMKRCFEKYPAFMADPIGQIREALNVR